MNDLELSDDQEGILSFIQSRRPDLYGGLTVGMVAEARRQDASEVEEAVTMLIEAGLLQQVAPGSRTREEAGKPCYGPTAAGLEWLRKRDAEENAKMIATIESLRPK